MAALTAEQLFDSVGPAYESAFANLTPQQDSIQWLLAELENRKPAKILDIGSGTGRPVCFDLAEAGHDVLGIDISSAMIEAANQNVPEARFEQVDIRNFQSPHESFDAITIYFSLIASVTQEEIREAIRKAYGLLKSGGVFVFATVPVEGNNLQINWMGRPIIASSLSEEDGLQSVRAAGFKIEHNSMTQFLPRAAEAGICKAEDVWEEPHLFVYARKP